MDVQLGFFCPRARLVLLEEKGSFKKGGGGEKDSRAMMTGERKGRVERNGGFSEQLGNKS